MLTGRDLAAEHVRAASAIFEGTVRSIRFSSKWMDARNGDWLPATTTNDEADLASLRVRFDVHRSYRGVDGSEIEVETGLGGGDCGFPFITGEQYLVYAYHEDGSRLRTGICSPTDFVARSQFDLAYLRGEPEPQPTAKPRERRAFEKVCGRVVRAMPKTRESYHVLLLDQANRLPVGSDDVEDDGSFCLDDVFPGRYYLLVAASNDEHLTPLAYFPGVGTLASATLIDVGPHPSPKIVMKLPAAFGVAVRGTVSAENASTPPAGATVVLFSPDHPLVPFATNVKTDGTFDFATCFLGRIAHSF